jgi:succinate dehydrogenase/fumarate reductase cytochrome b subunit
MTQLLFLIGGIVAVVTILTHLMTGVQLLLNEWRNMKHRKRRTGTWLVVVLTLLLLPTLADATIINAASCSYTAPEGLLQASPQCRR